MKSLQEKVRDIIRNHFQSTAQIISWAIRLPVLLFLMDMEGTGVSHVKQIKEKVAQNKYKLYCLMLYSDLDRPFISFVKESHDVIASMSGPEIFVFWLEHFKDDIGILLPNIQNVDQHLDRNHSIKIAQMLNIPNSQLPCLVFFQTIDSNNAVVYSFDNAWDFTLMGEHSKAVFDVTVSVLKSTNSNDSKHLMRDINNRFNKIKFSKWAKQIATRQSFETLLKAVATGGSLF